MAGQEQERGGFYATIPAPVLDDPSLGYASMVLYAKIVNYARSSGFCYARNHELLRAMERIDAETGAVSGVTERTLQGWLSELRNAGHIQIDTGPLPAGADGVERVGRRIFVGGYLPRGVPAQGGEKIFATENNFAGGVKNFSPAIKGSNNINKQTPHIPPSGGTARRKRGEARKAPDWEPESFARLWKLYPKQGQKDKQRAMDAWDKLRPGAELIDRIELAISAEKKTELWARGIGIPYFCRYLSGQRWEEAEADTPETAAPAARRYVRTDIVNGREVDVYE